jgi:transcriptional regulator with XRE-family HTH domain
MAELIDTAKIKALREKLDLTQTAAAKGAKMSVQQWNNIETGYTGAVAGISLRTLGRVAKVLGVKPKDLLK